MKQIITTLITLLAIASYQRTQAQCFAQIYYQNNPNGPTTFWADSMYGVSNTSSFVWSFGDGTSGTGIQVSHLFPFNGAVVTYNVCLTVSDSTTGCNFTTCLPVTFPDTTSQSNCNATVTYTNTDSLYTFTATATGTAPYTYYWEVSGIPIGTSSVVTAVIDTLTSNNFANACVSITDANGCVADACEYISNANQPNPCNAYATYTNVGNAYTFTANSTGAGPVYYTWYIDSVIVDSSAAFTTVLDSNSHTICVTIIDANGTVCTDCIFLNGNPVIGPSCQAYFVIYPDSANGAQGYYYGYNYSTVSPNVPVLWDFGDGTTSTDPYPSHTYAQPGNYIVCLTVGTPGTSCYDIYCDSSFYSFKTEGLPMAQLTILSPSGISAIGNENFSLYPNPVTNTLYLAGKALYETAKVYSIDGRVLLTFRGYPSQLHVEELATGAYILELTSGAQALRLKFFKD